VYKCSDGNARLYVAMVVTTRVDMRDGRHMCRGKRDMYRLLRNREYHRGAVHVLLELLLMMHDSASLQNGSGVVFCLGHTGHA